MSSLSGSLEKQLVSLRDYVSDVPMINPILSLATRLSKNLDQGDLSLDEIADCLSDFTRRALLVRTTDARRMLNLEAIRDLAELQKSAFAAASTEESDHCYHLVFTGHPIFALSEKDSEALARCIIDQRASLPQATPLLNITLVDEHRCAMNAIAHARAGLLGLNRQRLQELRAAKQAWHDAAPITMNLASWVGYDLDGRDDIRWIDSLCFRLEEKQRILEYYLQRLEDVSPKPAGLEEAIQREYDATLADLERFSAYAAGNETLAVAANALTERSDKVTDLTNWAQKLLVYATESGESDTALEAVLLAGEMRRYSLGIGEIHLRLNALQVGNAIRTVGGKELFEARAGDSSRQLIENLSLRITALKPEAVNFSNLENERSTAGRLMILSRQILKHIDSRQPIRLLIAECERPLTLLSALYLAKQYQVADSLDISPLFETRLGLERGAETIEQLLQNLPYRRYIEQRGRLAIQTGFSDAGRFVGQLAASLAIERLQIKIARAHQQYLGNRAALLLFNTHGESLGRGGARGSVRERQEYILSPHVRNFCRQHKIPVIHESTFQGGDGYLWFQSPELAAVMITRLFEAEFTPGATKDDPLYTQSGFALDVFLSLKRWHEALFRNPDYGQMLDLFGSNMLPKTGSRPSKRAASSLGTRRDPSKIRAIVHNARLQQIGYLVNVIGGLGHAAMIDQDRFQELYKSSARLRLLTRHALSALKLGSTNTVQAYGTLFQRGFWIGHAYQTTAQWNVRSCRIIADALFDDPRGEAVERLSAVIRDDLLDLRAFLQGLGTEGRQFDDRNRILIDSLQVLRLVLMMEILFLVTRVPRFAESNATSRTDLIRMALELDIDSVISVIKQEFALYAQDAQDAEFSEPGRQVEKRQRYQEIESQILVPVQQMYAMVKQTTMVIGCLYGGHG